MKRTLIAPTLAALAMLGCETTAPQPEPPTPATSQTPSPSTPTPNKPASDIPVKPGGDAAAAVTASNTFGMNLYQELRAEDGNLAYSPASISIALAMTYAGAKGETAQEMRTTLAFPDQADALHGGWATVMSRWQGAENVQISVANRLFGDKKYTFEPGYLSLTKSRYGAPLEPVDFAGAPEAQRKHINDWVANKTNDLIKDLIPEDGVTSDTRMALVNAIYFKAKWLTPFDDKRTEEAAFAAPGGSVKVPMMSQTEHMKYAEVDGVKIAERPYKNSSFAAMFVLPEKEDGLAELEKKLDAKLLDRWTTALESERVAMKLPRFKIEPKAPVELEAVLLKMGMKTPFVRGKADFTGITNPPSPADRLFIEQVYHKAFVSMDEAGTEAAAATAVMMGRAGGKPSEPKSFEADRPFLFFVRDAKTGLVMFAGRVLDPTK
jgi:serpin B